MGIFTWLFRGEIVERTLHYQFLVPVRKEVLVVGKFLAGAIISIVLFETAVLACFYLTYSRFGAAGRSYVFDGPGLGQLGSYLLVTALACLGYGAVFLALSLLFKNPIIPGAMLMGWEAIAPIFPAWAQRLSVTFYLKHLCPVTLPVSGPMAIFTVVAEPVSPVCRRLRSALSHDRDPCLGLLPHPSHRNHLHRRIASPSREFRRHPCSPVPSASKFLLVITFPAPEITSLLSACLASHTMENGREVPRPGPWHDTHS